MSLPAKVYLVGAGPGDPGLLTLRGAECLALAEVVVYDALVNPAILRHASRAEHVFAGKKAGGHSLPQDDINQMLISLARGGRRTVRLKGGDPFVFGRGGEEALALAAAGVPFEVVPGVTSGIAAPAYFGVPVTHRGLSTSVSFITAHASGPDGGRAPLALEELARRGTLVFYMGLASLTDTVGQLLAAGRDRETPAALLSKGTWPNQRLLRAPLGDIAAAAQAAGLEAPVLLLVGDVVGLSEQLQWRDAGPLAGLRVIATHAPGSEGGLSALLRAHGADVLHFPVVAFAPAPQLPAIDASGFDWVVFSSPNAAEQLFEALRRQGQDARRLARARLCAIGRRTAHAIEARHLVADVQPANFEPGTVIAAMRALAPVEGARVLLPRADTGRSALPAALRAAGAQTVELVAYTTAPSAVPAEDLMALSAFAPELVTFTNSQAARAFAASCWQHLPEALRARLHVAVIGPVTAQAARAAGLPVHIEPVEHDVQRFFEAICAWAARREGR